MGNPDMGGYDPTLQEKSIKPNKNQPESLFTPTRFQELATMDRDKLMLRKEEVTKNLEKARDDKTEAYVVDTSEVLFHPEITSFINEHTDADSIIAPMENNCEVCICIPAFREGVEILEGLHSLASQKNVQKDRYEVIVIVNNPPQAPKDTLTSNQHTIELIRYLSGETDTLSEKIRSLCNQKMIDEIKKFGLRVRLIDKSSKGKTLTEEKANVGGARNRALAEAAVRFKNIRRNGIVAHSDADTVFDPLYIDNLINYFKSHPNMVAVGGLIEFREDDENHTLEERKAHTLGTISQFYYKILKQEFDADQNQIPGSNMASLASSGALSGGIPPLKGGETDAFYANLKRIGEVGYSDTIKTYPKDRPSNRTDKELTDQGIQLVDDYRILFAMQKTYAPDLMTNILNISPSIVSHLPKEKIDELKQQFPKIDVVKAAADLIEEIIGAHEKIRSIYEKKLREMGQSDEPVSNENNLATKIEILYRAIQRRQGLVNFQRSR